MKQKIPGIKTIYTIPCSSLSAFNAERAATGETVTIGASGRREIPFVDEPTMECEGDYKNNGRLFKAELKFKSSEDIDTARPLAFIAVDMYGVAHVVGTREKPFPMVKRSRLTGTTSKQAVTEYEITYNSALDVYTAVV